MAASVTEALCERMCAPGAESLDEGVREHLRRLVLDGIAVAVAGTVQERPPGIVAGLVREEAARARSTVIGFGFQTTPARAAYVNGVAMHVLDYEPMWLPANHALSTTLPAVLALGEALEASGEALALALVKGIEIQGCIREASGQWEPGELRFHPPGMVGPFSAAAAGASLLGLGPGELAYALGIAASRAGSVLANAGTMTKSTHCGLAAGWGLEAALLAARGFDANPRIFDDPRGYPAAFCERFAPDLLLAFGPPWRVVEPGYAIKMYPSQYGTHYAITAGRTLHRTLAERGALGHEAIRAARLVTPSMPYIDRPVPANGLAGKFSWQYTFGCALLDGAVTMATFEDGRRFRPDIEALLPKIDLDMRPDWTGRFDAMHVEAEVTLADGSLHRGRCDAPPGSWNGPVLSAEAHAEKVEACLRLALDDAVIAEVVELCGRFDSSSGAEVRRLLALVR